MKTLEGKTYFQSTLPRSVPTDGRVLVHNHIRHGRTTRCGGRGFRAWLQAATDNLERCRCGWADLPHYRIKGITDVKPLGAAKADR